MAHFIGEIKGQRGEASRLGSKMSGIRADVRGWNSGVKVYGEHSSRDEKDRFEIYVTAGSNGRKSDVFIGSIDAEGNFILAEDQYEKIRKEVRKQILEANRPRPIEELFREEELKKASGQIGDLQQAINKKAHETSEFAEKMMNPALLKKVKSNGPE